MCMLIIQCLNYEVIIYCAFRYRQLLAITLGKVMSKSLLINTMACVYIQYTIYKCVLRCIL